MGAILCSQRKGKTGKKTKIKIQIENPLESFQVEQPKIYSFVVYGDEFCKKAGSMGIEEDVIKLSKQEFLLLTEDNLELLRTLKEQLNE